MRVELQEVGRGRAQGSRRDSVAAPLGLAPTPHQSGSADPRAHADWVLTDRQSSSPSSSHSRHTQSSRRFSFALSAAGTIVTPQRGQMGGRCSSSTPPVSVRAFAPRSGFQTERVGGGGPEMTA